MKEYPMNFTVFIKSKVGRVGLALFFCLSLWGSFGEARDKQTEGAAEYYSAHLGSQISYRQCTMPRPTEKEMLPYMKDHPEFFKDKTVLDIGTGSGIIGLYAAKLGANKVVATDIDKDAIACTLENSKRLNYSKVIEARYVPPRDISAYAVMKPDESFDVIISSPPAMQLVMDVPEGGFGDHGDFGFSIIKGLERHLKPGGRVILSYRSIFYHEVLVKFARYLGYEVEHYVPKRLMFEEEDAIFNSYLARVLKYQNVPMNAFKFDYAKDQKVPAMLVREQGPVPKDPEPYYGLIIIKKKK